MTLKHLIVNCWAVYRWCSCTHYCRSIKDNFGVEINFPIIADLNMKVAGAYGMVQPRNK